MILTARRNLWLEAGRPASALATLLFIVFLGRSMGCRPELEDYDVCFNIFLERDYPLVETFLSRHHFRRGRVLVGPGDLETMCSGFSDMLECYAYHYLNCYGGQQRRYIERLLKAMVASFHLLCGTDKGTLQSLFYNAQCLERVNDDAAHCHGSGFDLAMTWKRIFRFQATSQDCSDIIRHTECLVQELDYSSCNLDAMTAYNSSATEFLSIFCSSSAREHGVVKTVIMSLICVLSSWHWYRTV